MKKLKIQIVKLGKQRYNALFEKLQKYKSDIFDIDIYESKLPNADFGWGYTFNTLFDILNKSFDKNNYDLCMGFIDYQIEGNLYGKCLDNEHKIFVISFYEGIEILKSENINPFNFMIGAIYRFLCNSIIGETVVHDETRGCLFDMLGNKWDIVYGATSPIICTECENKLKSHTIPSDFIQLLNKELKRIRKAKYYIVTDFINRHPYLSLFIATISGIIINIVSNGLYDLLQGL